MDPTTSQNGPKIKTAKRPDSLKVELLTVPEECCISSPVLECPGQVNVGFKNLSYSVRESIFYRKRRKILDDISGEFHAGDLTAVMGPSGCGKTSLMNILAGYTTTDVDGKLLVNDHLRNHNSFKNQSCYIMQNDHLQPLLTVYESMMVAARLQLNSKSKIEDKIDRIKEILEALGLWACIKVRTNALSGGQRKRLSIALELLKNPQVMFFDEPTSGLDSSTTKQCVMLLKQLAQDGKTIICTIHQPSALIFEMFDHLYAIAEGRCVYQGSIKGMLFYLEDLHLTCPPYHNPADYLLEVASGDHGSHIENLVKKSGNGQNPEWRRKQRNTLELKSIEHIDKMMSNGLVTPIKVPELHFPIKNNIETQMQNIKQKVYQTSFYNQLQVLLERAFLILRRDRTLTYSRILTHLFVALFIGILYFGIGNDAKETRNNANYLFYTAMFLMLTSFNCVTLTFPLEMPIIVKEHFNSWYSINSYYLSISLSDIPIQMFATLIYAVITFYMTDQPSEPFRLYFFLTICILMSLVAQSYGLLIGASFDLKTGIMLGPIVFVPFIIFSGFFVQFNDAHPYIKWIFHISYLKYGFEGLMLSIFGYGREKMPCSVDYCHFVYPNKFLEEMDMEHAVFSHCIYFLIGMTIFIRIIAYVILQSRVRR